MRFASSLRRLRQSIKSRRSRSRAVTPRHSYLPWMHYFDSGATKTGGGKDDEDEEYYEPSTKRFRFSSNTVYSLMEDELQFFLNARNQEEAIEKLRHEIKLSSQLARYYQIYDALFKRCQEEEGFVFDNKTRIPGLQSIVRLFVFAFFYREELFKCDECIHPRYSTETAAWLMSFIQSEDDFSTSDLNMICSWLVQSVIINFQTQKLNTDDHGVPELTDKRFGGLRIDVSCDNGAPHFFCPLVGRAGLLTFSTLTKVIYGTYVERGYCLMPAAVKTYFTKSEKSPHGNNVVKPDWMYIHDIDHLKRVAIFLRRVNIEGLREIYERLRKDNVDSFEYRMFCVLFWYMTFEAVVSFQRTNIKWKLWAQIANYPQYVPGPDTLYVLKYLENAKTGYPYPKFAADIYFAKHTPMYLLKELYYQFLVNIGVAEQPDFAMLEKCKKITEQNMPALLALVEWNRQTSNLEDI